MFKCCERTLKSRLVKEIPAFNRDFFEMGDDDAHDAGA